MRKLLFAIAMLVVVFLLMASAVLADEEEPISAPTIQEESTEEISALQAEIQELKEMVAALQAIVVALQRAQVPERTFSIGVMPIENAGRIPEVGDSFRQVLISALNETGIHAVESLDEETLQWVRRQDQLVREGWISPLTAPRRGELEGVTHYLLATVTWYEEEENPKVKEIWDGIIVMKFDEVRIREATLSVDFRLIDARTGITLESFRTESAAQQKKLRGVMVKGEKRLQEAVAREVAQQAAERIAELLNLPQPVTTAAN